MHREDIQDVYPPSPLQHGILFHGLLHPRPGLYTSQFTCSLEGPFDRLAFLRAAQALVDRHAIFRTAFAWEGLDEAVQVVLRDVKLPVRELDWSDRSAADQQHDWTRLLEADREQGFRFDRAPLTRLVLCKLAFDRCDLLWSFHHLIMDGWAEAIVVRELLRLYQALTGGEEARLPPAPSFRGYIEWLRGWTRHGAGSGAEAFWRDTLRGFRAPTPLPADREPDRGSHAAGDGVDARRIQLSRRRTSALRELARRHRLTLNTLVQGAWALVLAQTSGRDDVVFGAAVSGRPPGLPGVEWTVGPFVNAVPVRARVEPRRALLDWLRQLQDAQLAIRQYEFCPLIDVQGWSELPRERPLFSTFLAFQNGPALAAPDAEAGALRVAHARFRGGSTNYPLTLEAEPEEELILILNFDRSRFSAGRVGQLLGDLSTVLDAFAERPRQDLAAVLEDLEHGRRQREQEAATKLRQANVQRLRGLRTGRQDVHALQKGASR
ncbi:MAG TPA: condensation domain-containing protein [Thermoanaerobaculia bacterium]|jgi:hypothetical protein